MEDIQWTVGKSSIHYRSDPADVRYSAAGIKRQFDHPRKDQCVLDVNHRRAMVAASKRNAQNGILVYFEESPQPSRSFVLNIFADDKKTVCSLGAATIWSAVVDADAWQGLTVLTVSRDGKSFRYRNKVGIVKRATVSDTITPYWGKVKSISDTLVGITELEEDGAGGWKEIERVLPVPKDNNTR